MTALHKAREFLIKQNITSFELNVRELEFDKPVVFDTFRNYCKITSAPHDFYRHIQDGCTIIKDGVYIILIHEPVARRLHRSSAGKCVMRQSLRNNWTLAHEAGHVVLGHRQDCALEEREANLFASELLMPDLVLLELQRRMGRKLTCDEVSRTFGVTERAARNRLELLHAKSIFSAYLRRELLEKYEVLIDEYEYKKEEQCRRIIS